MRIVPPQTQRQVSVCRRAGCSAIETVGEPGVQGAGVLGAHGCGVKTPPAAAVAAAVAGNDGDMHGPNGRIFTNGLWSPIFAAAWPAAVRCRDGATRSSEGLGLIVQTVFAVLTTCRAIGRRYHRAETARRRARAAPAAARGGIPGIALA
jgi:hypothetical protein